MLTGRNNNRVFGREKEDDLYKCTETFNQKNSPLSAGKLSISTAFFTNNATFYSI